uniref:Decapping nuclease n=1 Tax=Panagrolaimus sp. PS1159 TaxID=55785 RepID=A0AC35EXC2_9BILA
MANDNNNHRSGILMPKPSRFNAPETYFSTKFRDGYFTGQNHPIAFQPAFIKHLKPTYDAEIDDIEIDLYSGSNEFFEKPVTTSFDVMLDYMIDQRTRKHQSLETIVHNSSVVTRRGVLNKLLNAPYKDASEFKFAVKKFRGIFFIKELETLSFLQRQKIYIPQSPLMFLTKFKHLLTSLRSDKDYDPPKEVCSWEQNQGLFQCELRKLSDSGGMKIFYGSEIDAMDKEYNFLEIKLLHGQLEPRIDSPHLCEKIRKWYFQSKLVQSETVVVGFREYTVVNSVKKLKVDTFPNMVNTQYKWNPDTCYSAPLSVISTVCEFYDKNVKEDETLVVELKPFTADLTYLICHDGIHTVLSKKFKDAFSNPGGGCVVQTGEGFMDGALKKRFSV